MSGLFARIKALKEGVPAQAAPPVVQAAPPPVVQATPSPVVQATLPPAVVTPPLSHDKGWRRYSGGYVHQVPQGWEAIVEVTNAAGATGYASMGIGKTEAEAVALIPTGGEVRAPVAPPPAVVQAAPPPAPKGPGRPRLAWEKVSDGCHVAPQNDGLWSAKVVDGETEKKKTGLATKEDALAWIEGVLEELAKRAGVQTPPVVVTPPVVPVTPGAAPEYFSEGPHLVMTASGVQLGSVARRSTGEWVGVLMDDSRVGADLPTRAEAEERVFAVGRARDGNISAPAMTETREPSCVTIENAVPPSVAVRDGDQWPPFALYIGCRPVKGGEEMKTAQPFEDYVEALHSSVCDATGVLDCRLLDFGRGKAMLAAQCYREPPEGIYVVRAPQGPLESIVLEVVLPYAQVVVVGG